MTEKQKFPLNLKLKCLKHKYVEKGKEKKIGGQAFFGSISDVPISNLLMIFPHFRVYITIGIIVIFAVTVVVSKIILERTVLATKTVNVTKPHAQIHTEMS